MSTPSDSRAWIIHTDGAARGNPGPAAYSFTIERPGEDDVEESAVLGDTTNNIAEYTALVRALKRAKAMNGKKLTIHSDSELMVKQMRGEYKVKNEGLRALFDEARSLARAFENVAYVHVRREQNKRADQLCNDALDGVASAPPPEREDALTFLQACAEQWSRGDANDPPAGVVLEKLAKLLK